MGYKGKIKINREIFKLLSRRIFSSITILFLLITFVFVIIRITPGSPLQKYVTPVIKPELREAIKESYGFDEPVYDQYISFVKNLIHGDLGYSYTFRLSVSNVILQYLPFTILLSVLVLLTEVIISFVLVKFIFFYAGNKLKKVFDNFGMALFSLPTFVTSLFLIYIFSLVLGIFPSSGLISPDFEQLNSFQKFLDYVYHLILPVTTLVAGGFFVLYRYLYINVYNTAKKEFVLKLLAEGEDRDKIFWKHIIPNAAGPFINISALELGILLSGTLITEVVFSLPGMGRLTVDAMLSRDYPLIIGTTLVSGTLIILSNLAADLARALLDKRTLREFVD